MTVSEQTVCGGYIIPDKKGHSIDLTVYQNQLDLTPGYLQEDTQIVTHDFS